MAKNYRPISLLECLSKLLEKAISKRMLHNINTYNLIPTMQFGTQAFSCMLDVGLSLMHDIQVMQWAGLHCAALMFDIKGFFNNVHKDHLVAMLHNLGFPPEVCHWNLSFLSDWKVQLSFNRQETLERDQLWGCHKAHPSP